MTMAAVSAALSVPVGACLGALYDLVRLLRVLLGVTVKSPFGEKGLRRWFGYAFVILGDLFFCLAAAAVMCVFFFLTGDGRMRAYGLCGAALGFFAYYQTVGRLVIRAAEGIQRGIRALFHKIGQRFLQTPIVLRAHTRYNEYKRKKKEAAAARKRKKRMRGGVRNGI